MTGAQVMPDTRSGPARTTLPVSVLMRRRDVRRGDWRFPDWAAEAVVSEAAGTAGRERTLVHESEAEARYLWHGFELTLYRDSAESYWYNLVGRTPSLFVICRSDEAGELEPFLVTANYDEAGSFMEADDTVFSVPIAPDIYRALERYVVEHYVPREPKKRKREAWAPGEQG